MAKVVRMKDIAERAGVSRSAVSLALGNSPLSKRLNEATKQRILQAAKELGYRRDAAALSMVTGKSQIVGFGAPSPSKQSIWHHALLLDGIIEAAEERDLIVKTFVYRSDPARLDAAVDKILSYRLAGLLCQQAPEIFLDRLEAGSLGREIPLLHISAPIGKRYLPSVFSDDDEGCRLLVEHLFSLGHRDIGYICGPGVFIRRRQEWTRNWCRELGMTLREQAVAVLEDWSEIAVERAVDRFVNLDSPPTAVLCATDSFAAVAMRRFRRHGLSVPQDVSVVGYSDDPVAALCDPPLTSIRQPFCEMGRIALRRLLQLDSSEDRFSAVTLPVELALRQSTAPARSR